MSESREYFTKQTEFGAIHISEDVILSIAAAAVMEVEGVASLNTAFGAELQDRLVKKGTGRGIKLNLDGESLVVECSILVLYGPSMQTVGTSVQDSVCQAVESMTGLTVATVNVHIAGISTKKV